MALADHVLQAQKGIKKSFDNGAKVFINRAKQLSIFNIESTDEFASIFTSTEGFTGAKELSESETPQVAALGDGYSKTLTQKRFGGAYVITEDDMMKMGDSTTKINEYLVRQRNRCLRDNERLFNTEIFKFLNYAFATTYYAAPDTAALCTDTHTWKSGQTFDNKGTQAFDEAAFKSALEAISQVVAGDGEETHRSMDTIVVKKDSQAEWDAVALFAEKITPTSVGDVNVFRGTKTIIATPDISYANRKYWFLFDTSVPEDGSLYVGIKKFPSFTEPKMQDNENIRQNVTGYWMQGIVNMPDEIWGSTGAA